LSDGIGVLIDNRKEKIYNKNNVFMEKCDLYCSELLNLVNLRPIQSGQKTCHRPVAFSVLHTENDDHLIVYQWRRKRFQQKME